MKDREMLQKHKYGESTNYLNYDGKCMSRDF